MASALPRNSVSIHTPHPWYEDMMQQWGSDMSACVFRFTLISIYLKLHLKEWGMTGLDLS